jgi:hypothetical protein
LALSIYQAATFTIRLATHDAARAQTRSVRLAATLKIATEDTGLLFECDRWLFEVFDFASKGSHFSIG